MHQSVGGGLRTSTEPTPSGRTRSDSPLFARSSRAAGSSLSSAKTVPLAKKAAVREWHRPAMQRFTHRRHEGSATTALDTHHHTEVSGVQRLASALRGGEFRRPAVSIYHRRRHLIRRSIGAPPP
eukprot:jgi/Tetstr1/440362/TSEL_028698.t1